MNIVSQQYSSAICILPLFTSAKSPTRFATALKLVLDFCSCSLCLSCSLQRSSETRACRAHWFFARQISRFWRHSWCFKLINPKPAKPCVFVAWWPFRTRILLEWNLPMLSRGASRPLFPFEATTGKSRCECTPTIPSKSSLKRAEAGFYPTVQLALCHCSLQTVREFSMVLHCWHRFGSWQSASTASLSVPLKMSWTVPCPQNWARNSETHGPTCVCEFYSARLRLFSTYTVLVIGPTMKLKLCWQAVNGLCSHFATNNTSKARQMASCLL